MFDCTEGSSSSQLGVTKVFSIFFDTRHPISSYPSSHFVFFIAHFKPQYCDTTRGFLLVLARMQWSDKIIQNSSNSHKVTCKVTCIQYWFKRFNYRSSVIKVACCLAAFMDILLSWGSVRGLVSKILKSRSQMCKSVQTESKRIESWLAVAGLG